jgi:hypothetical protein
MFYLTTLTHPLALLSGINDKKNFVDFQFYNEMKTQDAFPTSRQTRGCKSFGIGLG